MNALRCAPSCSIVQEAFNDVFNLYVSNSKTSEIPHKRSKAGEFEIEVNSLFGEL